ncbi:MAG: hypothetical protein Q7V43_33040 [Myxococcales bacterium]|nr:hypothetical protein [Myxococcales bacterium]
MGAVVLAGCSDDEWLYRPRDAGARMDSVVVVTDGAVADRGVTSDTGGMTTGDVPTERDVGAAADAPSGDVPMERDAGTDVDAGQVATGLAVRAQGLASTESGSAAVGMLRVSETGFELGERGCAGSLCVVGGLVP